MTNVTLTLLGIFLILLLLLSAFFSAAETGMMAINRYRLRHLVRAKHPAAMRVNKLLERTDKLLGVILIGTTFANIFASAIVTLISVHFFGLLGVAIVTLLLTFVILIFAEISPKIWASLHAQKAAFVTAFPLSIMLTILYPFVFLSNLISKGFLRLLCVNLKLKSPKTIDRLSHEELRKVVMESNGESDSVDRQMLLRIIDSAKMTVDDVMVPRNEIIAIDYLDEWETILKQLVSFKNTRLPLYEDDINNVKGIINLRKILPLLTKNELQKSDLLRFLEEPYFVPEGTPLTTQILNFRQEGQRCALVVDEYGDIQGWVTVGDIIEEIVGEITTDISSISKLVSKQIDGSYRVDGSVNIRELNRLLNWELPTDGPKTLNGIITEALESIPVPAVCLLLNNYPVEILEVKDNLVKWAKIYPKLSSSAEEQ